MSESTEHIDQQIADRKTEAQKELRKLAVDVDQHKDLTAARKKEIGSLLDSMDEQITLIQSSSREMLASARGQLRDNMRKIHTEIENAGDQLLRSSMLSWRGVMEKLDEQLEAAAKRFSSSGK
jgi:hypothetical protein